MNSILRFQAITGRKDGFVKIYEISTDSTLYDLHRFIQNDLDFDESQMAAFFTSNNKWDKNKQHALFDMGDGAMDSIVLADLLNGKINHLVYTFDFFNNRSLFVEYIGNREAERRVTYPNVAESEGIAPDQFADKPIPKTLPIEEVKSRKHQAIVEHNEEKERDDFGEVEDEEDDEENDFNDDSYDEDDIESLSEGREEELS